MAGPSNDTGGAPSPTGSSTTPGGVKTLQCTHPGCVSRALPSHRKRPYTECRCSLLILSPLPCCPLSTRRAIHLPGTVGDLHTVLVAIAHAGTTCNRTWTSLDCTALHPPRPQDKVYTRKEHLAR